MIEIKISENEENQRLDKFLRKYLSNAPLSFIYRMVRKKNIKLNGKKTEIQKILKNGDILTLYLSEKDVEQMKGQKTVQNIKKNFKIAYEDENIIVVEKPKGLLIHGTEHEKKDTLVNQVVAYLYQKGEYDPKVEKTFTPAAVHRLDRNTSGLVIFGKNYKSIQTLNAMIRNKNDIRKFYIAMVSGNVIKSMHIKGNIIKNEEKNKVVLVSKENADAKEIETIFKPLIGNGKYTLIEVELITGRTHQIRAHLADSGFPLIGDEKYGNHRLNEKIREEFGLTSQYLHAYKLIFENSDEPLSYLQGKEIYSELPKQLTEIKEKLFTK